MSWRILVADVLHPVIRDLEKIQGVELVVQENISEQEFLDMLPEFQGVVLRSKFPFKGEMFERAGNLKFIARGGAGLDGIDLNEAANRGIEIISAPEGNSNAVAEHTLGLTLGLLHRLHKSNLEVMEFIWQREENRGRELAEMVVGILGFGNMGKAFGHLVSPLAKETIAYDIDDSVGPIDGVRFVDFEEFRMKTQILSVHIQLNQENIKLINKEYLKEFTNLKFLVNTSRGKVVALTDILDLLKRAKLDGVGLDVLPIEDMNSLSGDQKELYQSLFDHPMAIVTPHIAGWSKRSFKKIGETLFVKIQNFILQNG